MFITIKYKNQTKKFQWKKTFSIQKFKSLLTQVFSLKSNIYGLIAPKSLKKMIDILKKIKKINN